jgi:very-short-patch-repair endonuclease
MARATGWSDRSIRYMIEMRHWKRVAGIAFAPRDLVIGPPELAAAAVSTWPAAVVSHELAAALWRFPQPSFDPAVDSATVTVPANLVLRGHRLTPYRYDLLPHAKGRLLGLAVTTREWTAVDLLAHLSWDQARQLWAWLVTRRILDLGDLAAAVIERKYRDGTTQLRRLLDVGASGSVSAAEDVCHDLLQRAGISGWRANMPVVVGGRTIANVDLLFEAERVIVEIDGWSTHRDRAAFQRDRLTQNRLVAAGYTVLRFTWEDLTSRPSYVIDAVRQALGSRGS